MAIVFVIGLILLLVYFPFFRFAVAHPILCIRHGLSDIYDYVKYHRSSECKEYGHIRLYTASDSMAFGSGKTLTMVRDVTDVYEKYNDKDVWDEETQSFVKQHIIIISNIELKNVPYTPFIGKNQFIDIDKIPHTEHDIIVFVIDEAGFVFNSREYKTNMPLDFLARLLQVRHNKVCFYMTAQRFGLVDKILRQTTEVVTTCKKVWRIVRLQNFDAYALENCPNPAMIMPYNTRWYFATNKLYNSYDTTYNVETLKEQYEHGDLLTTEEILSGIGDNSNPDIVKNKWRGIYRRKKK